MKIAHIFWGLGFGGIETMLINIANAQAKYGADVHIVLINELYEQSLLNKLEPSVSVHLLNRRIGSKSLYFIWKLNATLHKINPDKIHLHGPEFYAMLFYPGLRCKTSLTLHALPFSKANHGTRWGRYKALLSLGFSDGEQLVPLIPKLFAISNSVKDAFNRKYDVDSDVVFNGILVSHFLPRSSCFFTPPCKIVQISRLDHHLKGQDLLIKAASLLNGKVDVTFIGDGDSMTYLKDLTNELGMNESIHFLGKKTQEYVTTHLKEYDLFVQPSRREGFGLTVAEAMAAKVPVLVASGQGPAEVTENNKYGWIFANGDEKDLASQIQYIIDNYNDAAQKADFALKHIKKCYDVSVTAKRYLELY